MRLFLYLSILISLAACTSDVAGGTGSNAGEAEIAYVFKDASGRALPSAKINLWKMEEGALTFVDSSYADTSGSWKLSSSSKQKLLLEAWFEDSLAYMCWVDLSEKKPESLILYPTETLEGTLMQNEQPFSGASLQVLNRGYQTNASGDYFFDQMPRGIHLMLVNGTQTVQLQTNYRDTIDLDVPFILIENFEDWGLQTILGKFFGGGWWYYSSNEGSGGLSFLEPAFESGPEVIATKEEAFSGRSLHVKMTVDSSLEEKFALVGFSLGDDFYKEQGKSFFDLSSLSAVTFRAKGNGSLFLQWVMKKEGSPEKAFSLASFTLSENWTFYRIPSTHFDGPFQMLNALNFMAEEDADLWLDDIRFEGIGLPEWNANTK